MKFELTRPGNPTEAIGAYSGYRLRLVAARDAGTGKYTVEAWFRGSESLPETALPFIAASLDTAADALDAGYAAAVQWIDRLNAIEAENWGDEPDPGTGYNG